MNRRSMAGHLLMTAAVAAGILGMGSVFNGAMHGSASEIYRGLPFLLLGLWWSGRDLGRSMLAGRSRSMREATEPRSRGRQQ
jgi:hypothetical protein